MAFNSIIKRLVADPDFQSIFKKAAGTAVKRVAEKAEKVPGRTMAGSIARGLKGATKVANKIKNPAEDVVESATKMKKGGAVDKMGRAVKRKTADVKGRAMKGK